MGYKVKRIYQGTNLVRPSGWIPGANTLAYFPFKEDGLDKTGNYTLTNTGTQGTIGRIFTGASNFSSNTPSTGVFVSCWIKITTRGSGTGYAQLGNAICGSKGGMCYNIYESNGATDKVQYYTSSSSYSTSSVGSTVGQRFHLVRGYDGSGGILYKNGVATRISTSSPYNRGEQNGFVVKNSSVGAFSIELSEFIAESRFWTAQEIQGYYNGTKSTYGL